MMKKLSLIAIPAACALAASMMSGCGPSTPADKSAKTQLNVAAELFPESLEPSKDWEAWYLIRFGAGETLVTYDSDGNYIPGLAESWDVAPDGLTWTFTLKKNVTFSNGKQMTASDVVKSIERLFTMEDPANGGKGNPQSHFTYSSLKADDESGTVTIVTTDPTPDMPGCMAYPWTAIIDVEGSETRDIATQGPIMTGPYAFESFTQDSDAQMVRNEHYWNGDVPFEKVNIRHVKDSATRALSLQDGSVDMALNISSDDRQALSQDGKFAAYVEGGSRTGYTHINFAGPLGNDALRKAVVMAIDGKTIADVTTSGAYLYGQSVISSSLNWGYDDLKFSFSYDPQAATDLLDKAGITDSDGDGIRELNGKNIDLDYKVTANRSMDTIAQAQAAQLSKIGIKATVTVTQNQSEQLNNHQFDLISSNEVATQTGDPSKFLKHWYSGAVENYSNYSNPRYNEVYDQMSKEFDPQKRKELMTQLQQILADDAVSVVYGYFTYNIVADKDLKGVEVNPNDFYWVTNKIRY